MKYSSNYESYILNFFGEFDKFSKYKEKKELKFINYPPLTNILPYKGKLQSRLSFLILFILGFFPLKKFLIKINQNF